MITVQVDQEEVETLYLKELKKRLNEIEHRRTLWDMNELCRQTCMSENNIKDKFFYDPRFPKHKVGGKWYFPAKQCEAFLLQWIKEH